MSRNKLDYIKGLGGGGWGPPYEYCVFCNQAFPVGTKTCPKVDHDKEAEERWLRAEQERLQPKPPARAAAASSKGIDTLRATGFIPA